MESTDSSGRVSSTNTENAASVKELLADSSEEKVYEYFCQTAWNLREVVESFDVLKERLGLEEKCGLDLYRGLRLTLGAPNSKTWKARDMLNLLDKRANQKEYMQQVREGGMGGMEREGGRGREEWEEGMGGREECEGGRDGRLGGRIGGLRMDRGKEGRGGREGDVVAASIFLGGGFASKVGVVMTSRS